MVDFSDDMEFVIPDSTALRYRYGSVVDMDQSISFGAKITKKDIKRPNILTFSALQSTRPKLNDEVHYFDANNVKVFGGYIQKIEDVSKIQKIEVGDYSSKYAQEKFSAIYLNMSPEAIIEDIITNYTDLTFVSTVVTGIIIEKQVFKDEWKLDAIVKMLEIFNGAYSVDLNRNFNMRIEFAQVCLKSLMYGNDILSDDGWTRDISVMAEKVIVLGAITDQRTTETLAGTGTVFYTTFKPENIQIGTLRRTTTDIAGDYTVDEDNKKITFNASQTDPSVSYTYKSQVRVEIGSGKTVILEKKYIESKSQARKLAMQYRDRFYDGAQNSKWTKIDSDIDSYNVGDSIYVSDDMNNATGSYVIKQVTLEFPNKITLDIGETEEDLFDWQKETVERLRQLESNATDNTYITLYDYLKSDININVKIEFTELKEVYDTGVVLFASDTNLATNGDLISDTGIDTDYALAYDNDGLPADQYHDYLA
jgi:hypothetical protein